MIDLLMSGVIMLVDQCIASFMGSSWGVHGICSTTLPRVCPLSTCLCAWPTSDKGNTCACQHAKQVSTQCMSAHSAATKGATGSCVQ
jgi:hypothetical protein